MSMHMLVFSISVFPKIYLVATFSLAFKLNFIFPIVDFEQQFNMAITQNKFETANYLAEKRVL